jgi:hypothetical protein
LCEMICGAVVNGDREALWDFQKVTDFVLRHS